MVNLKEIKNFFENYHDEESLEVQYVDELIDQIKQLNKNRKSFRCTDCDIKYSISGDEKLKFVWCPQCGSTDIRKSK